MATSLCWQKHRHLLQPASGYEEVARSKGKEMTCPLARWTLGTRACTCYPENTSQRRTPWLCLLRNPIPVPWQMWAESGRIHTPQEPESRGAHPPFLEGPGRCRAQMALAAR